MYEEEIKIIRERMPASGPFVIAVDGRCGSGKSTFGQELAQVLQADLFHMDDFFLRMEQRTEERYRTPGENADHERFAEVIAAWRRQQPFSWQKFDCGTMSLLPEQVCVPRQTAVVEGTYSMHPSLRKYYDLTVFLEIDPVLQKERILRRSGEAVLQTFIERWIPLEEMYFSALDIRNCCDLCLKSTDGKKSAGN